MKLNYQRYLQPGEELWYVYRRHGAAYALSEAVGCTLIMFGFFFLWPLFNRGAMGVAGLVALIVLGLAVLSHSITLWRYNVLLVTSLGVVDVSRTGLWGVVVSRLSYPDVQDVSWARRGFGAFVLRYGTVSVVGAGGTVRLAFPCLPRPAAVAAQLTSLWQQHRLGVPSLPGLWGEIEAANRTKSGSGVTGVLPRT